MRHAKRNAGICLAIVLVLASAGARVCALDVQVEKLYDDLRTGVLPCLYDTDVLYQDGVQGNYHLYLLDAGSKDRSDLYGSRKYLYPVDFGGTTAAWITYRSGTGGGGIAPRMGKAAVAIPGGELSASYRVDMIDVSSKTVTTIGSDSAYKEYLGMDDASVVWTDFRHMTETDTFSEVYHCRISNESVGRLTDHVSYKAMVAVDGDKVVWQDYRNAETNGINADIFVYDMGSGQERAVCVNGSYQAQPDVCGDYVVWQDYRNVGADPQNADIYLYDLSRNEEVAICTAPGYQASPRIHGNFVVWQDYRNTGTDPENTDIYLYDIETGVAAILGTIFA